MDRPRIDYSGTGNLFSFKFPVGWSGTISSLARQTYDQGMFVAFDFMGDRHEALFYSPAGKKMQPMSITFNEQTSLPIVPQEVGISVDVQFYCSPNSGVSHGNALVDENMKANALHIVESGKTPGSFEGVDAMTFTVFVEDTQKMGLYNDAVCVIHLLKKDG
ncbi:hypothetical protein C8F01DRAFT_1369813 [Mycena amicta]|nr:hypothetical protein C8F01DRAFT_1369813 [Mycena amicta]